MSIQGRRYASDGSPLGDQFQVNTYTTDYQLLPSVSAHADGDFLVVWGSNGSSGTDPNWAINGQRYASDGTTIGDEFQVNTSIVSYQLFPSVSVNPDGGFAVVWQSEVSSGTDSSSSSIQGQRYAALFADGFESGSTSAWSRTIP